MEESWKFYKSVIDGEELLIDGMNIWDHDWTNINRHVAVKDPIYEQNHIMNIYEISIDNQTIRFAAGEFSNLVWGIYLPEQRESNRVNHLA